MGTRSDDLSDVWTGGGDLPLDQLVELEARTVARASAEIAEAGNARPDHGDPVDLPWWQHPVNIMVAVVTATALAAIIGWIVGIGAEPGNNAVDTGFLQDMREHHEQAILMGFAFRELPDTDPVLRLIATEIIQGQSIEIGRMIQLLRDFGEPEANPGETSMGWMGMPVPLREMPGMATDAQLEQLAGASGSEANELFITLMTAHHLGGIHMADYAANNGENDEVVKMAAAMANNQRIEIAELIARAG